MDRYDTHFNFSVKLNIFPSGGMHTIGNDSIGDLVKHLVLPVITLGLYNTAIFTNYVEASVNEQLKNSMLLQQEQKDYQKKSYYLNMS